MVVAVMIGILLPIRILAFSPLRVRSFGFASVWTSPIVRCALIAAPPMPMPMLSRCSGKLPKVRLVPPATVSGVRLTEVGRLTPSSVRRSALTSSTSASISTSASGLSNKVIKRSASWMFSRLSCSTSK